MRVTEQVAFRVAETIIGKGPLMLDTLSALALALDTAPSELVAGLEDDGLRQAIGASVEAAMVDRRMTVRDLAGLVKMTPARLNRRMQGLASFAAEDLVRLSRVLDVEVAVLVG